MLTYGLIPLKDGNSRFLFCVGTSPILSRFSVSLPFSMRMSELQGAKLNLYHLENPMKVSADPEISSRVELSDKPASFSTPSNRKATAKTSAEKMALLLSINANIDITGTKAVLKNLRLCHLLWHLHLAPRRATPNRGTDFRQNSISSCTDCTVTEDKSTRYHIVLRVGKKKHLTVQQTPPAPTPALMMHPSVLMPTMEDKPRGEPRPPLVSRHPPAPVQTLI